jgi:hypothetical protein
MAVECEICNIIVVHFALGLSEYGREGQASREVRCSSSNFENAWLVGKAGNGGRTCISCRRAHDTTHAEVIAS